MQTQLEGRWKHAVPMIIPIEARHYSPREGRLRDPFGHLWIVSQAGEELAKEEVEGRIDRGA